LHQVDEKVHIAIKAMDLLPDELGGAGDYLYNLVHALARVDEQNEYLILLRHVNRDAFSRLNQPNFHGVVLESPLARPIAGPGRVLLRLLSPWLMRHLALAKALHNLFQVFQTRLGYDLAGEIESLEPDLVHFPQSVMDPLTLSLPCVLTLHDIQQEYYPEFFTAHELGFRRRTYRPSAEKASLIITDSGFTKQTLVEKYQVPATKIYSISMGVNHTVFSPHHPQEELQRLREKYCLPEQFAFYPANTWPHKNHVRLVRAWTLLGRRARADCPLVLTGKAREGHKSFLAEVERLGLQREILYLGYVPRREMPLLYAVASFLIFPSLFEGFGLPVLEAMASGCPVACSSLTAPPEIAGGAALLFDHYSEEEIAEAARRLIEDGEIRQVLRQRGLERAREFSWEKTAQETLQVYYKALQAPVG
jgi:glycosyltransferase involved in cell wall biosynthesis